jgi:hypothetical protein
MLDRFGWLDGNWTVGLIELLVVELVMYDLSVVLDSIIWVRVAPVM